MERRNNWFIPVMCLFMGRWNGFNIGYQIGKDSGNDRGDKNVHEIQLQNQQIAKQLTQTGRLVANLVLVEAKKHLVLILLTVIASVRHV